MDLSTKYLGIKLKNPFVVGASPLSEDIDTAKKLEDAGAAAVVMYSLFEEQIVHHQAGAAAYVGQYEEGSAEATSYFPRAELEESPDQYLRQLQKLKKTVTCPVIASINGIHKGTWVEYARSLADAGADAIELNVYFNPLSFSQTSAEMENEVVEIVKSVRQAVRLPLAVKLAPFFSALPHFVLRLQQAGANAVVLFNRLFQPNIDIDKLEMVPQLRFSDSSELFLRLRWVAALYHRIQMDISLTGGVLSAEDAVKSIMAGADCIQLVSTLLMHGPAKLKEIIDNFNGLMQSLDYESVAQMKGCMSYIKTPNPDALERANYVKILNSWKA